ncbi:tumor necrosis factor receptor superfamily member 19-like [Ailuropoda melanoleuca]|uniref:tumor necrosis factor receptor superfamily member 19-like n=1 Tax=Ailuropoda melanoleuca TaxID=9646 RepID=UPI001494CBF5|nr:tumor necrosis factor receptor superfamily member 19-like [Ailuropoda melanoleuca]XP_034520874.1 tumor necrosis factor receptor superfamily member 19-like [Ailuropoda melanoleuca]
MALKALLEQEKAFHTIVVLLVYLACEVICETGDCRQQEFRDRSGNCVLCKQCGPGMELSKECGFGYGEDAQCMACRPHRFKEDWGFQKCKPCLECAAVNRFQKANCSVTSDAICGDCLPGYVGPFLSLVIREFFFNRHFPCSLPNVNAHQQEPEPICQVVVISSVPIRDCAL